MSNRRIRYTMDMSVGLHNEFTAMARDAGMTKSEVLRRGVALFKITSEAIRNGKRVGVTDDPNKLSQVFIL